METPKNGLKWLLSLRPKLQLVSKWDHFLLPKSFRSLNFTTGPNLSNKWRPSGTTVVNFRDQNQFRSPIETGFGDQVCLVSNCWDRPKVTNWRPKFDGRSQTRDRNFGPVANWDPKLFQSLKKPAPFNFLFGRSLPTLSRPSLTRCSPPASRTLSLTITILASSLQAPTRWCRCYHRLPKAKLLPSLFNFIPPFQHYRNPNFTAGLFDSICRCHTAGDCIQPNSRASR